MKNPDSNIETSLSSAYAMVAGKIVPLNEAQIPLLDRGFLFGQAVFETVRLQFGKPQHLEDHLARLEASRLNLNLPEIDFVELRTQADELCNVFWSKERQENSTRGVLKIILTSGSALQAFDNCTQANVYLICYAATEKNKNKLPIQLLSVVTAKDNRFPFFRNFKVTNYLPAYLLFQKARASGFDDFIYYNENDELTESGTANFIWTDKFGMINTCHSENNALKGVTLSALEFLLMKQGKKIGRNALRRNSLGASCYGAVFLSSIRLARPIGSIDGFAVNPEGSISLSEMLNSLLNDGG